jgi:hypothetical protein
MKKLLIIFMLTASPAMAGGDYPEEAQRMSKSLSVLNSAHRSCKGMSNSALAEAWDQAHTVADIMGYDWERIERNARSRNYNPSRKLCEDAGHVWQNRWDYLGSAE